MIFSVAWCRKMSILLWGLALALGNLDYSIIWGVLLSCTRK
jgi:hypothetical protein